MYAPSSPAGSIPICRSCDARYTAATNSSCEPLPRPCIASLARNSMAPRTSAASWLVDCAGKLALRNASRKTRSRRVRMVICVGKSSIPARMRCAVACRSRLLRIFVYERRMPGRGALFQVHFHFLDPAQFGAELFDHQGEHPHRFVEFVAHFLLDGEQCLFLACQLLLQKLA